jgi:hypothetical protein
MTKLEVLMLFFLDFMDIFNIFWKALVKFYTRQLKVTKNSLPRDKKL